MEVRIERMSFDVSTLRRRFGAFVASEVSSPTEEVDVVVVGIIMLRTLSFHLFAGFIRIVIIYRVASTSVHPTVIAVTQHRQSSVEEDGGMVLYRRRHQEGTCLREP
jgi:hypothetical protein